jgi:hypothetical protein
MIVFMKERSYVATVTKAKVNNLRLEYFTIKNDMLAFDLSDTSMNVLYDRIQAIRQELSKLGANAR